MRVSTCISVSYTCMFNTCHCGAGDSTLLPDITITSQTSSILLECQKYIEVNLIQVLLWKFDVAVCIV